MDSERIVARIISGLLVLRLQGRRFILSNPTRLQRYFAQEVYAESFASAAEEDLFQTDDEVVAFLASRSLWSDDDERKLVGLPKDIEKMKEGMFEHRLQSNKVQSVRGHLRAARTQWGELYTRRHAHDALTCNGHAALARGRYLVGCGLRTESGKKVFQHEDFWKDQSGLLEAAVNGFAASRLSEDTLREIARTDPWRGIWAAKKSEASVFGKSVVDLTDEQRSLTNWSVLYDSIRSHSECPPEDVIEDDDMLDGWLSIQRKKSEKNTAQKGAEDTIKNSKIKNSQEIFLMADTPKDAQRINDLNDAVAKRTKAQRLRHLKEKGQVDEWNMPDTKLNNVMGLNQIKARAGT